MNTFSQYKGELQGGRARFGCRPATPDTGSAARARSALHGAFIIDQHIVESTNPVVRHNAIRRTLSSVLLLLTAMFWGAGARAAVVDFSGGPTTTQSDSEVFFSPLSGGVWASYSDSAIFGIGNVSGMLAIAFNATDDGTFVVSPNSVDPSLSTVALLSSGAIIGPGSVFDNTEYTLAESDGLIGNWNGLGSGFVGFQFGTGADTHYGWADITVLPDYNVTLNSFAYETVAGQAITTPVATPEPSFKLLGLGAGLGLILYRRIAGLRSQARFPAAVATIPIRSDRTN